MKSFAPLEPWLEAINFSQTALVKLLKSLCWQARRLS
jgi:hypothetical protein